MGQRSDRKILRIGIIQNGKIIEERLLRKREPVTIGQSPRNTFVLPASSVPRSFTLFELKGGTYHLHFREDMDGRVSVDDAVLDFRALRERKLATKRTDGYALALSEKSRGKVVVGEVTLLFQFVTPPPPPSKLQLPASVRGGWVKGIDWHFASILLGSTVLQLFTLAFVLTRDYPERPKGIEAIPDRFVEFIIPKKQPTPPPKELANKEEKKDDEKGEEKVEVAEKDKPKPKPKPEPKPAEKQPEQSPEEMARAEAERRQRRLAEVQNKTILKFVGTTGGDGPGSIVDTLNDGAANVAVEQAFEGTSGVVVADADTAERDRRRVRTSVAGKVASVGDDELQAKGSGPVDTGSKGKEIAVKGNVNIQKPSEAFGTGVLDSRAIASVVSRRKRAIQSCYEKQLKRNPKLAGKVKVQFTINEMGRVGEARVVEDTTGDRQVGVCIVSQIKRWRFPRPDGGSVTVAFPFLFTPAG